MSNNELEFHLCFIRNHGYELEFLRLFYEIFSMAKDKEANPGQSDTAEAIRGGKIQVFYKKFSTICCLI